MYPQLYLNRVFFIVLLSVYLTGFCLAQKKYKIRLISLEKCKLPSNVMFKNAPVEYSFSARKVDRRTTLIKAYISVSAREGPVFFSIRGYQMTQSSSKDLIIFIENVTCNNIIAMQVMKILNLKLDKKCYAIPGNYSAESINLNDFSDLFAIVITGAGKYSLDLEFSTSKGVAACIDIACELSEK